MTFKRLLLCLVVTGVPGLAVAQSAAFEVRQAPVTAVVQQAFEAPLSIPTDVAFGDKGDLYIVDSGNSRVVVLDRDGDPKQAFGSPGSADGELDGPVGIAVARKGNVYVADRGNGRIAVFSSTGEFVRNVDLEIDGKAVAPVDVAVSGDGSRLFVTSANLHSVLLLTSEGELLAHWGGEGEADGEFHFPGSIVVSDDTVLVVDILNTRVQAFTGEGDFLHHVGKRGAGPGTFFRPKGLAVDTRGRLFVGDGYFGTIQELEPSGEFRAVLGTDEAPGRWRNSAGIAIDRERLAVVESLAGKVSILSLDARR